MSFCRRTFVPCLVVLTTFLGACGGDSADTPLDEAPGDGATVGTDDPSIGDAGDLEPPAALGGRIAFQVGEDGATDIYVMDPDGGARVNITNQPSAGYDLAWSPDGSRIAFASDRERG